MLMATFRFYEELNDFLPPSRRKNDFTIRFKGRESVKDLIEALGIPHTEVDLILINGTSVGFNTIVKDRDRISVYPVFESLDIKGVTHLRKLPLRTVRFIADNNIMDVVKYMRALGFDVVVNPAFTPREIIDFSKKENRTILTKSRHLLKFKDVTHGIFIRQGNLKDQIRHILTLLNLFDSVKPFSRCLVCNTILSDAPEERIETQVPPKVKRRCETYVYCVQCQKIYWQGTHHEKIKAVLADILHSNAHAFLS